VDRWWQAVFISIGFRRDRSFKSKKCCYSVKKIINIAVPLLFSGVTAPLKDIINRNPAMRGCCCGKKSRIKNVFEINLPGVRL
jgi:hypothetical protein